MTSMSLPTIDEVLDATEHLPQGASLVIPQFSWDDYERLLEEIEDRRHLRLTYDCGTLEIMSPLTDHERYARLIDALVDVFCDAFGLRVESFGCATWKKKVLQKGAEGDACYYIREVDRVIGKRILALESDPPPDVVVEIDTTRNSLKKLRIYAAFGVEEVWRYNGKAMQIFTLRDGVYAEIPVSNVLPTLTGSLLAEFIELSEIVGHTKARHAFIRQLSKGR
jgi:Uma2 family endonuclease